MFQLVHQLGLPVSPPQLLDALSCRMMTDLSMTKPIWQYSMREILLPTRCVTEISADIDFPRDLPTFLFYPEHQYTRTTFGRFPPQALYDLYEAIKYVLFRVPKQYANGAIVLLDIFINQLGVDCRDLRY